MQPFFTALPESIWAEVNRRLRIEPALWALAQDATTAATFVKLGDDLSFWRPGPLALAAGKEVKDKSELPLLMSAGRDALALKARLANDSDFANLAAEVAKDIERWALVLICLYGLLEDPKALTGALIDEAVAIGKDSLIELVARIWAANESPTELAELAPQALKSAPVRMRLVVADYLAARGLHVAARAIAMMPLDRRSDPPANFRELAEELERVSLKRHSGEADARAALGHALEAAQSLTAELALRFGRVSMDEGDPVSALVAFKEAKALRPNDSIQPLVAEAKLLCDDDRAALVVPDLDSKSVVSPCAQLAAARVQKSLGNLELARASAVAVVDAGGTDGLSQAVDVLLQVGAGSEAGRGFERLVVFSPVDECLWTAYAQYLLSVNKFAEARDAAWSAVGLAPEDADARQLLAESLAASGNPAAAIPHWRRAIELDEGGSAADSKCADLPQTADASNKSQLRLRLAETALAADDAQLAFDTAKAILDNPNADDVIRSGRAHIIAGQALAKLDQPDRAFEYFNQAAALAPASPTPWQAIAAHHRAHGDLHRALAAINAGRQALGEGATSAAELHAEAGGLHAALNQWTDAAAAFEKAVAADPQNARYHQRLGEIYRALNQYPASIESLRRAAALNVDDPAVWHALGRTLEAANQLDDALAAYEHAEAVGDAFFELFRDIGRLAYQLGEIAIARHALQCAINAPEGSNDILPYTLLGAIYEQSNEFAPALDVYKRAITLAPTRSGLCVRIGVCCLALGQPEAAIAALKDAAERDLDDLALQRVIGDAYAAAQLWLEAQFAYEQAARLAPDDPGLLRSLAHAARQAGNTGRAIEALQQAVALTTASSAEPQRSDYLLDLAELCASSGRLAEARALYHETLKSTPDSIPALTGLGQVHLMLRELPEAASVFEQASHVDPARAETFQALGEANALLGNFGSAHTAFIRAAELEPANPLHLRRAGECLWQAGRHAPAIAQWQKNLIAHPKDAATHAQLGRAFVEQGRHQEALAAFEHAAAEAPTEAAHTLDAARCALAVGAVNRALTHLEHASKLAPGEPEVWKLLGSGCRTKNLNDKALTAFRRAVQLSPQDGAAQASLAQLLAETDDLPEAVVAAEAALKYSPDDPTVLVTAADVFIQADRFADARRACIKATEIKPTDAAAQLALARALTLESEAHHGAGGVKSPEIHRERLMRSIEHAAALGADPAAVREWAGRARAVFNDPAEAIPLLEAAAIARPSADLFRQLAICYRRVGKLTLAQQAIQAAVDRAPDSASNLIELGRIDLAQNDKAGARTAFQRAIGVEPRNAQAHWLLAEALLALDDRDAALPAYTRAIALDPTQAAWHHRLAEFYAAQREPAAALAHYQRAAALAKEQNLPPLETGSYFASLARAHARDGDLRAALDHFETALALNADVPDWWVQCGEIAHALGDAQLAFECFDHAGKSIPGNAKALMGAARAALALGRAREAEEKVLSVLRFDPDNADALIAMAEILAERGERLKAIDIYERAAERAGDPALAKPIRLAQAKLLRASGRAAQAADLLQTLSAHNPDDDETLGQLGEALIDAGRADDALQVFQRATHIAPRNAAHYLQLGRLCHKLGHLDAALGHLKRVRELEPENAAALREIGLVFEDRRQFDRAYTTYEKLIALQPDRAENFFRAGVALKGLRDYSEAARMFQHAAEIEPGNVEAERQRLAVSALGLLNG